MPIDQDQVNKIAHLARLEISEDDLAKYTQNLSKILSLVDQMNSVDTKNLANKPKYTPAVLPLREDAATETNQRENLQQNAPMAEAGLYLVPKVIE